MSSSFSAARFFSRAGLLFTTFIVAGCCVLPAFAANGVFVFTNPMGSPRGRASAILLNNGKVLIVGGNTYIEESGAAIASAEVYDPVTNTFSATANWIGGGRAMPALTKLANGTVLVTGGYDSSGNAVNTAMLYDPGTNSFTAVSGTLVTKRYAHSATLLTNGKVLIAGGMYLPVGSYVPAPVATAELYDPATQSFTSAPNAGQLGYGSAVSLNTGKVLLLGAIGAELYDPATNTFSSTGGTVIGGCGSGANAVLLGDGSALIAGSCGGAWTYNPISATFTATGAMAVPRYGESALAVLPNGKVLLTGGNSYTTYEVNAAEIYDPSARTWSATVPMTTRRGRHITVTLQNGEVLVAGGFNNTLTPNRSAELFLPDDPPLTLDPEFTYFHLTGSMTIGRYWPGITVMPNGQVMVVGGYNMNNDATVYNAQIYDPNAGTFATPITMSQGREGAPVVLIGVDGALGSRVMVSGGWKRQAGVNSYTNTTEVYWPDNPAAGFVQNYYTMTPARGEHTASVVDGADAILAGGDTNAATGGSPTTTVERYKDAYDQPVAMTPLLFARGGHTATVLRNGKILIAGGANTLTAELYDPPASSNTGSTTPTTGSMVAYRYWHTATLLGNGKVLLTGGLYGSTVLNSAELYDPATGTFSATTGSMTSPRWGHYAVLLPDGRVLIGGGRSANAYCCVDLNTTELYDPATNAFYPGPYMVSNRFRAGAALMYTGNVLVAGGTTNTSTTAYTAPTAEVLELGRAGWTGADLRISINGPASGTVNTQQTYTIVVTNDGPMAATAAGTSQTLPTSWTFISATPTQGSCSFSTATVTCSLGTVTSAPVTITLVTTPTTTGTFTQVVSVSATSSDPNVANNNASTTTQITSPSTATASVTSPNGGEKLYINTPFYVTWTTTGTVPTTATFNVNVSTNGGSSWAATNCVNLPSTARGCWWSSPATATSTGRIQVVMNNGATAIASDMSDANFTVLSGTPLITVTSPNYATLKWTIGTKQTITWTHNLGGNARFAIAASRDNGASWTWINTNVAGAATTGSYDWIVSGPATTTALIRVYSNSVSLSDTSNYGFSIVDPAITVTIPNTALNWAIGTAERITWTHNLGTGTYVNILVSRDAGTSWATIATGVANTAATSGYYDWTVTGPAATTARIRVQSTSPAAFDDSNVNFIIANPTVTVTSPNSAVNWRVTSTQNISWTHNLGANQPFNIYVSRDNGATWAAIATNFTSASATSGTYPWVVSGPVSTSAKIRVSWATNSAAFDDSNVVFTIANPSITVTSPNTAVSWRMGSTQNITWTHNLGANQQFNIYLSRDNGVTWTTVATNFTSASATSGTFPWAVPSPATSGATARIRVTWVAGPTTYDDNNVSFTISNPTITVTSPNTAVNWAVGTTQNITWTHNLGANQQFNIYVSRDNGVTWAAVATNFTSASPTSGTYPWPVSSPSTSGATARIRVTWVAGPATYDDSNVSFIISVPTVAVTAPNTAADWAIGTTQNITWTHNLGAGKRFRIELYRNGVWEVVNSAYTDPYSTSGTYPWVVNAPAAASALIRVSWIDGTATDTSNVYFSISNPYINVPSPATGATNWGQGTQQRVTWTTNLSTDKVDVRLSADGGATYPYLLGSTTASYKYMVVTMPVVSTTNARIRVQMQTNSGIYGVNPANFQVTAPYVTVTKPNSVADIWRVGSYGTVYWANNLGSSEKVKLELSVDGGASYPYVLNAGAFSTGAASIMVPSAWVTQSGRVRVTWLKNAAVTDTSDANFPIVPVAPDLTVYSLTAPTTPIYIASSTGILSFSVTDITRNAGYAATTVNTYTQFYLSVDGISPYLQLDGAHTVGPLAVSGTSTATTPVVHNYGAGLAAGTYARYVIACADNTNSVAETFETNNCMAKPITLIVQ